MSQQTDRAVVTPRGRVATRWTVFFTLAVLTVVEFIIAVTVDANVPIIFAIAVAKALLIVVYFMHVARLWRREEHD